MSRQCPECTAPIPDGGSCLDNFHALLLLESQIPGGLGAVPHFYAVSCYVLQHPDSMNYTSAALAGLRTSLADVLRGRATINDILRRVRRGAEGARRVTRRAGEEGIRWRVACWPLTVVDVCAGGIEGYGDRVARWAQSTCDTLAASEAQGGETNSLIQQGLPESADVSVRSACAARPG